MLTSEKMHFQVFKLLLSEAFSLLSEHCSACKELYEGPGGNLVDGLSPAPVRVQGGASCSTRPERTMCDVWVGFLKI